jgi:hypothetical protein
MVKALKQVLDDFGADRFQPLVFAVNADAAETIEKFNEKAAGSLPIDLASTAEAIEFAGWPAGEPLRLPTLVFVDTMGVIRKLVHPPDEFFQDVAASVRRDAGALLHTQLVLAAGAAIPTSGGLGRD